MKTNENQKIQFSPETNSNCLKDIIGLDFFNFRKRVVSLAASHGAFENRIAKCFDQELIHLVSMVAKSKFLPKVQSPYNDLCLLSKFRIVHNHSPEFLATRLFYLTMNSVLKQI